MCEYLKSELSLFIDYYYKKSNRKFPYKLENLRKLLSILPEKFDKIFEILKIVPEYLSKDHRNVQDIEISTLIVIRLGFNIILFQKVMTNTVIIELLMKKVLGCLALCSSYIKFTEETWISIEKLINSIFD